MSTPSNAEQQLLQLVNRARMNPGGEFNNLVLNTNPVTGATSDITDALNFFNVNLTLLKQQLLAFAPVAPLAWNTNLDNAAAQHSALMIQNDTQSHQLPGEPGLGTRITNSGYSFTNAGENIFAYATDPVQADAAFIIDWGSTPTGMQDPAGHRINMLSSNFVEVGINATPSSDPSKTVGPLVITEDFGNRAGYTPQVVGAVFRDANNNQFYDPGEGLGGVTVTLTGSRGTFTTTTWSSGGYEVAAASGSYTETFSGGGLQSVRSTQVTISGSNIEVDLNAASSGISVTASTIQNDYLAIVRASLSQDQAMVISNAINSGTQTEAQYIANLITTVANSTGAALLLYDFIDGVTPTSASLDGLTATANNLIAQAGGNPNASWQQMGASLTDSNFNAAFATKYASLSVPSLVSTLYSEIYGSAPSTYAQGYFANLVSYYANYFSQFADSHDPTGLIRAKGTLVGDMLKQAMDISWGKYPAAEKTFLTSAANGTAVYGQDLLLSHANQAVEVVGVNGTADHAAMG